MTESHDDNEETATFLIGEAVRRVMMQEVQGLPPELMQIAWDVFGKIAPAALLPDEFDIVDGATGIYPPDFRRKYAERFRKADSTHDA